MYNSIFPAPTLPTLYPPYSYPPPPLPIQHVWPPHGVEEHLRHHTYGGGGPRTLTRGVTFDADDAEVSDAVSNFCKQMTINEAAKDDLENNEMENNEVEREVELNDKTDTDNLGPKLLVPSTPRTGSLVSLQESRRGSLFSKYKSV